MNFDQEQEKNKHAENFLPNWGEEDDKAIKDEEELVNKLQEYADKKQFIKELQNELSEIEGVIKRYIAIENNGRYESEVGSFSVQYRKKWEYSEAVVKMNEQVKAIQKDEQKKGIAKLIDEKAILVYRAPKK